MTDAQVTITPDIMNAQHDLAQQFYNCLENRAWDQASLLLTANERGHVSGAINITGKDGSVDVIDTPDELRMPIIGVRLAMRLPDERSFETLLVTLDNDGNTQLKAVYKGEQPQWVMPAAI